MKQYGVRVFDDHVSAPRIYTVPATSDINARLLAFVMDGGLGTGRTAIDPGEVELALTYTEVME